MKAGSPQDVRARYGFDLPDELWALWDFARKLNPRDPADTFRDTLGIRLVGPFDVIAGSFARARTELPATLHWRFRHDPPEFLTVWSGDTDGLHYGYWMDEGPEKPLPIASYYARDAYEISLTGTGLFEALRAVLESYAASLGDDLGYCEGEDLEDAKRRLSVLEPLRAAITKEGGPNTGAVGDAYRTAHWRVLSKLRKPIAMTVDRLGIVAPKKTWRPLSVGDEAMWKALRTGKDPKKWVAEAQRALTDGHPATALKLGKDLWGFGGDGVDDPMTATALGLLVPAYEALGRPVLRDIAKAHAAHRWLRSVDILEYDEKKLASERRATVSQR